jgi:hypothetical protein
MRMAPEFRQKDGRTVPITPRKLGVGGVVVALGLGLTFGVGAGGGAGGAAGAGPEIGVQPSISVRAARTSREKGERTRTRLSARGEVRVRATQDDGESCAEQATGQVRTFLLEHPCRSLQRGTVSVASGRDRVVVAVAWVAMPDAAQAADLQELIDTPGTGSIRPLDRRIELTGQHYASRREGELVTVAEAEPDGGSVPGRVLEEVAQEAAS